MVTNISPESIEAQKVEKEEALRKKLEAKNQKEEASKFSEDHYLDTRLGKDEKEKEIVIRLLPFSANEPSPFKKIHVHSVKMRNENGERVWKKFMCPIGMGKSEKCPFCETAKAARDAKFKETDEVKKKEWNSVEFMNMRKDYWLVRCIDRAHEEHGPKFWRFPDAKSGDGIWDKMYSLYKTKQNRGINIFDLYEGKDLVVTVKKQIDSSGKEKLIYQIQDDEDKKPLSKSEEQMEAWVNHPMTWEDVYSIKSYDYMSVVVSDDYPVWSKTLNRWIGKHDAEKINKEAKEQEVMDNLRPDAQNFSSFTVSANTKTEQAIEDKPVVKQERRPEDDLPF